MSGRTSSPLVRAMQVVGARERLREIAAERDSLLRLSGGAQKAGGRTGRLSRLRLDKVRQAYTAAEHRGDDLHRSVAQALHISASTAKQYITMARGEGLLPRRKPGRPRRTP